MAPVVDGLNSSIKIRIVVMNEPFQTRGWEIGNGFGEEGGQGRLVGLALEELRIP